MADVMFADRTRQSLYFDGSHEKAGLFKGMAVILEERGLVEESKLRAQCKNFQCLIPSGVNGMAQCCCHRVLYNQPDFEAVESTLETVCKARSFLCYFYPSFTVNLTLSSSAGGLQNRFTAITVPLRP